MMKNIWQWQEPDAQRNPWLIGAGVALAVLLVIIIILAFCGHASQNRSGLLPMYPGNVRPSVIPRPRH